MNKLTRRCSVVLLFGLAALLASPTLGTAGIITTYAGIIQIGNGSGAGAWSYGHEATGGKADPNNIGYDQYTSGAVIFALDPYTVFDFSVNDINSDGLNDDDTVSLDFTIDIYDFSGNIFDADPLSRLIMPRIGWIRFYDRDLNDAAILTVGGNSSPSFTYGISGELDFDITFTANASHSGDDDYLSGDTIEGTAFFQAANFTDKFSGIEETGPTSIEFAIWGDNRDSSGDIYGTHNGYERSFGFDIVVEANVVPEPSSLMLLSMGAISLLGYGWRRKRKLISAL